MYHFGFIIENVLGHVTHGQNLRAHIDRDSQVKAEWGLISYEMAGWEARLPIYNSNWTVRSGARARKALAGMRRKGPLDALFFHTQVMAMLAGDWLGRFPSVLSLDATPRQYDSFAAYYRHSARPEWVEKIKWRLNRDLYRRASHLVTWSEWARQGLVTGYEVPPEKVTVIPPGVDIHLWGGRADRAAHDGPPRVLFVGGDLERKGGFLLLEAVRQLRDEGLPVELHMVTGSAVETGPGVHLHSGLRPNSPELLNVYQQSDIFCLPTRGDCLPVALCEAAAAGLPSVATSIAGIPEAVRDGVNGFLVPPGDSMALVAALRSLANDAGLRARQSAAAREIACHDFNAEMNTARLLELLKQLAGEKQERRRK